MKIDRTYRIRIDINDKILTYTGKVIDIDPHFVTFIDKFGTTLHYNLKYVVSYEEVR